MRTFLLILLTFVAGVMVFVAVLSWQGRAAREYGREAVQAAARGGLSANAAYEVSCQELLKRKFPNTVQSCVVKVKDGRATATLRLEGQRTFQVGP
ncbi:hypothetical protein [Deinococcus apachensis]|uniref:hypothetical protein n=1 Tax=Deinococcus apachensis TaxID=309886 RepID=UPI0003655A47|nr:hypothetical protein [Deinococcus apachensis]